MATTRLVKSIVFTVPYLFVRSSRSSALRDGVAILDECQISLGGGVLSPLQRPLCFLGRPGGKEKERAQGTMGRGKREERLPPQCY